MKLCVTLALEFLSLSHYPVEIFATWALPQDLACWPPWRGDSRHPRYVVDPVIGLSAGEHPAVDEAAGAQSQTTMIVQGPPTISPELEQVFSTLRADYTTLDGGMPRPGQKEIPVEEIPFWTLEFELRAIYIL